MDDLVKEFIDETIDSLGELDMDLVKLEQDPQNQDLLGKVFRLMHTIKGTCGFIGLSRLEKTAHAGENLLDNFRNGKMEISEVSMTLLFMCIDRVRFLVSEVDKNGAEPTGDDTDIIEAIEDDIKNALGGGSAPAAVAAPADDVAVADETLPEEDAADEPEAEEDDAEALIPAVAASAPAKPAATGAENTQAGAAAAEKSPEYLRVQMNVLEELINMVSELVLTRNQLLQLTRMDENTQLNTPLQRLNRIVSDLQDNVMKTRMQPIGNAWSKLPRIVRDLASEMKKKITLEMKGEDTELDRQVLEMIKDPLTHMIRNSCDHGVEAVDARVAAGKPEGGTIKLHAYHEGGFIIIRIEDDGKGLDPQKIAAKAIEKGILDAETADKLNEKQILNYIMKPGFSTAETVTNVSGRGVGMDVVRTNIEKIGGSIDMESTLGQGTSFTIQIPLTLAIISALIVKIDGCRYAIPQMNIQELVSLDETQDDKIEYINDKPVLRLRDRIIPLLDSRVLFESQNCISANEEHKSIAIISSGSTYYGVIIDEIYDTEEVVIKSVSSVLKKANIFSGNTILGDGQVIMILDPAAIARKFNVEKETTQSDAKSALEAEQRRRTGETASMLVFKAGKDSLKAVPLAMVSRLQVFPASDITKSADKMVVQFNGGLMQVAFIDAETQTFATDGDEENVTSIILSDDRSDASLGLIIDQVVDIVDGVLDLNISTSRPGILGAMILDGKTVDVIDIIHFLGICRGDWFSQISHSTTPYVETHLDHVREKHSNGAANDKNGSVHDAEPPKRTAPLAASESKSSGRKPSVLVVDDSLFFRNMLHPILTSAGYDVTLSEDAISAIKLHDEGRSFDVILSDIEMPEMDGYEFVEKMRAESAWKDTPFIAITSHNTPADVEYGYKKGFNQYIGKFDKDELIASLKTAQSA